MRYSSRHLQSGQAMLTAVIFFLVISTTVVLGIASPILKQIKIGQDIILSKQSYYAAASGLEDVVYRLRNAKAVTSPEVLAVDTAYATTTIVATASGQKVVATGKNSDDVRLMQANLTKGNGVVFKYGTQAGQGGVIFQNNAHLDGTLYANGNIVGANGAYITGDAYVAGSSGSISNMRIGYGGTGEAHAHTVTDSTITGNLYCQSGSGNNKSCDTSQSDPVTLALPISDTSITDWKSDAAAGTVTTGDVTISSPTSMGPRKIVGNLTINSTLTITDTIWVTGNVTISGTVKLASSYAATTGMILADGYIDIGNGVVFQDSGTAGSYIMMLSTSSCDSSITTSPCFSHDAITVSNNSNIMITNAQNGTIYFSNNASVKEAVGKTLKLKNNVGISYGTGLVNVNFTSGPSGDYTISSWQEVQ